MAGRLVAVAIAIATVACGGAQRSPTTPPVVEVIDPGAEPRQLIRLEPPLHVPERFELTFKFRLHNTYTNTVLETGRRDADWPSVKLVGTIAATSRDASGTRIEATIEHAELLDDVADPALRDRLAIGLAAMEGTRMAMQMAANGHVTAAEVETAPGKPDDRERLARVKGALLDLWAVAPDVPVGVGASWRETLRARSAGVTWDKTVTYTLRARTDAAVTVEASVASRAGSQALSVEPNASTKLTSGSASGHAEVTLPLDRLVPSGTQQATTEMNYLIVRGHLRISSALNVETMMSIQPAP